MSGGDRQPAQCVRVDCYAGYRGEETPRRIHVGRDCLEIKTVRARWITPDSRYFSVVTEDNRRYQLEQDVGTGRWEIMPVPGNTRRG